MIVLVNSRAGVLSLHVWRKTPRAGMPAILFTTTDAATDKEHAESRDRDLSLEAFSALYLVAHKFLLS